MVFLIFQFSYSVHPGFFGVTSISLSHSFCPSPNQPLRILSSLFPSSVHSPLAPSIVWHCRYLNHFLALLVYFSHNHATSPSALSGPTSKLVMSSFVGLVSYILDAVTKISYILLSTCSHIHLRKRSISKPLCKLIDLRSHPLKDLLPLVLSGERHNEP